MNKWVSLRKRKGERSEESATAVKIEAELARMIQRIVQHYSDGPMRVTAADVFEVAPGFRVWVEAEHARVLESEKRASEQGN